MTYSNFPFFASGQFPDDPALIRMIIRSLELDGWIERWSN